MFVAGWNITGCLPEMEPTQFHSFAEAKGFIIDELKTQEDQAAQTDDSAEAIAAGEAMAEIFCHGAERVNLESSPFSFEPGDGYAYWVEED